MAIWQIEDPEIAEFIEIPTGIGMRNEPVIKGKGTPVWVLVSYAVHHQMTPEQISDIWNEYITPEEVRAALAFWQKYPELVDDRLSDSE